MNARSPNPPIGEPIAADDGGRQCQAPAPQITLITKHRAQSLMSKRISLDADGKLKSDRLCGLGRPFCLRCKGPRRPAFDEVAFWPPALGSLRGLCLTCIGVMHRRTLLARFAAAAADLRVSFPHGDPGLSDEPPTFESREFAAVAARCGARHERNPSGPEMPKTDHRKNLTPTLVTGLKPAPEGERYERRSTNDDR